MEEEGETITPLPPFPEVSYCPKQRVQGRGCLPAAAPRSCCSAGRC